jgi:hypothetical protein
MPQASKNRNYLQLMLPAAAAAALQALASNR